MAVKINFYTFGKKENSTLQPSGSGTEYDCKFIEPCDMLSPTISLNYGDDSTPTAFNYCKIPTFNRYYYITDWTYDSGLWYASLSVDALASWRTQIGTSEQYILRATYLEDESTKVFNGKVIDNSYPAIGDVDSESVYPQLNGAQWAGWQQGPNANTSYVVGIINKSGGFGAVTYYVFTPSDFDTFKNNLITSTWWTNDSDEAGGSQTFYDELGQVAQTVKMTAAKAQINPLQYIASCMWFPFEMPHATTAETSVDFGWFSVPATCYKLSTQYTLSNVYFELDNHPQVTRGSYLNLTPYTRREIYFYNWGNIPIDTTKIAGFDTIYVRITVDGISGLGILTLLTDDGSATGQVPFYRATTQVGVPVQLAQITNDSIKALTSGLQVGAGLAQAAVTHGVLGWGNVASGIGSALNAMLPQLQTSGSQGSFAAYRYAPSMVSHFTKIAEEHFDHVGRPYCHARDVNDLYGYMVIGDAEIDFACTPTEKETIVNYMEGGFFYE